ncbi:hypothetical protein [Pedobacter sp. L105]|uniref:hypothetical protein n=1 Tax=Pedobacter sp. L105 TaxID=1641871 RepID=UPI00131E764A|nr:hypothetical protein [Pedobacter sp. L105]
MKTTSKKKIKEIGKLLGVNFTVDKTLSKYAKIVPEKMEESNESIGNSVFNF